MIYESRLSGTSQHGVLWKGGDYQDEGDWVPVFSELVSNNEQTGSDHGSIARYILSPPVLTDTGNRSCRGSDTEINTLRVATGDTYETDGAMVQRLYRSLDLEVFYFNSTNNPLSNCDREGPKLEGESIHQLEGTSIHWDVQASDDAGVWRVLVVFDEGPDASGHGTWNDLELTFDNTTSTWRGEHAFTHGTRLRYVLQAVDRRGNVSWLRFEGDLPPASGVEPEVPKTTDVLVRNANLAVTLEGPDTVRAGESLRYTVKLENHGPDDANDLDLLLTLPSGSTYQIDYSSLLDCQPQELEVICTSDRLESGAVSNLDLFARAPEDAGIVRAQVVVTYAEDDRGAGVTAHSQTTVQTASDLGVEVDNGLHLVEPGHSVLYTARVLNHGPAPVYELDLDIDLSDDLEILQIVPSAGNWNRSTGKWSDLALEAGQNIELLLLTQLAPRTSGKIEVTAQVATSQLRIDDVPSNNTSSDVDLISENLPPTVASVTTTPIPPTGQIRDGVRLEIAVTQLHIVFDESVVDAYEPTRYLLVESGPDEILQTVSVDSGPQEDDRSVEISDLRWDVLRQTAVLDVGDPLPLPRGTYRLLISGALRDEDDNPLDGNGDGRGGDDFRIDWSIDRQQLLLNPNFDTSMANWRIVEPTANSIVFHNDDADSLPTSGSLSLSHKGASEDTYLIAQCLPSAPGERFALDGRVRIESSESRSPRIRAAVELFEGPTCILPRQADAPAFVLGEIYADPQQIQWQPLGLMSTPVLSAGSALIYLRVDAQGTEDFSVQFDSMQVFPLLFSDGFETGDTSRWSTTQ